MYIIGRLNCEMLSRIAVKISFLCGRVNKMYIQQQYMQPVSRHDIYETTCKI